MLDPKETPLLAQARDIFRERHRFTRDIIDRAIAAFGSAWARDCETTLRHLFPTPEKLALAVKGYSAFAVASMRGQLAFERDRTYPSKTYEQAASEVYFNDEYMMGQYLPGLLLSHYLWPHHYRQLQFFDSAFIEPMVLAGASRFAEVGVGTGLYSRRVLERVAGSRGQGFDISPSSKRFADAHIAAFGFQDRYDLTLQDVVAQPMAQMDWIVCVEVLEHLQDPVAFLRALRGSLAEGGRAFITAALTAAHADHIYLYESADAVLEHLTTAGFALEQSFLGAAYKPSAPGVPVPLAAAFVVV